MCHHVSRRVTWRCRRNPSVSGVSARSGVFRSPLQSFPGASVSHAWHTAIAKAFLTGSWTEARSGTCRISFEVADQLSSATMPTRKSRSRLICALGTLFFGWLLFQAATGTAPALLVDWQIHDTARPMPGLRLRKVDCTNFNL